MPELIFKNEDELTKQRGKGQYRQREKLKQTVELRNNILNIGNYQQLGVAEG